jgi:hypothetical protein
MTDTESPAPRIQPQRLPVKYNATKHGILSPLPVVTTVETVEDWEQHREAILDSLNPAPGIEEMLAERVALLSWRLNRVTVFETSDIEDQQAGALDAIRQRREQVLKYATLHREEAKEMVAGVAIEEDLINIIDRGDGFSDLIINALSDPMHPISLRDSLREHFDAVHKYSGAEDSDLLSNSEAFAFLEEAVTQAVRIADGQRASKMRKKDINAREQALADGLLERMGEKETYTGAEVEANLVWLAEEAGVEGEDGEEPAAVVAQSVFYQVHKALRDAEARAEEVERQIKYETHRRMVPRPGNMDKIPRYEAHLSRQMYQALHELEALQTRRMGGQAPLARIDISGIGEN